MRGMQERAGLIGANLRIETPTDGPGTELRLELPLNGAPCQSLKTRILLADDHALVRRGLRLILDAQPDLEVVAEAGDGAEAVKLALSARHRPGDPRHLDAANDRAAGRKRASAAPSGACAS